MQGPGVVDRPCFVHRGGVRQEVEHELNLVYVCVVEILEISVERISVRDCNCFYLRKAARHLTQIYDTILAPSGIRSTQYMILAVLNERRGLSVNELAEVMVMDRTTMGKNLRPLVRDGLIAVNVSDLDRRSRTVGLTKKGFKVLGDAYPLWKIVDSSFQKMHGRQFSEDLRGMLDLVTRDKRA
ncbi:MarR family transcriptional regulator [Bradyrhizobium sp. RT4b]|uniref:MarR family winged helix-turn-helix transcriptional regulator n=1 Tax=Bradyrhizobium sp. RT4b TaxID=3156379 RepID=UPI00339A09B5